MRVKSYIVNDMNEAMIRIKGDLGKEAVILSTHRVKKSGFFGFMKKGMIEVVAAVDEEMGKEKSDMAKLDESVKVKLVEQLSNVRANDTGNGEGGVLTGDIDRLNSDVEYLKSMLQSLIEEKRLLRSNCGECAEKESKLKNDKAPKSERVKETDTFGKSANMDADHELEEELKTGDRELQTISRKASNSTEIKKDEIIETLAEHGVDKSFIDDIQKRLSEFKLSTKSDQSKALQSVLKDIIGDPFTIEKDVEPKKVIFLVGPTGVGKTTTIAKVSAKLSLLENKKIALITADTYRIAAVEQLRTYSEILGVPISVIYEPEELPGAIKKYKDKDYIIVDTAGRSHKSEDMQRDLFGLFDKVENKEIFLVLSATTGYKDMCSIIDSYKFIDDYKVIVTKLDETSCIGGVINLKLLTNKSLTYFTIGQNVPDDIEVANSNRIVSGIMGGL